MKVGPKQEEEKERLTLFEDLCLFLRVLAAGDGISSMYKPLLSHWFLK